MEPLRIAVVGDDPLARSGLAARVAGEPALALAGELAAAEATPSALRAARADAAAWDLGDEGGEALREAASSLPVVALISAPGRAGEALAAGARGALLRDVLPGALAAAAAAATRGLIVLDAAVAREWLRPAPEPEAGGPLTRREREVLGLLAEGLSNRQIGARLGIAERTAKFHVESILGKLGAVSRAEAVALAARRGLLSI